MNYKIKQRKNTYICPNC